MKITVMVAAVCASFVQNDPNPPILPFTELSDAKIKATLENIVEAGNTTDQDCKVFLQLDHIQWKYQRMREIFYKAAREANDGATLEAKHLGKIFDKIDMQLDAEREAALQEVEKKAKRDQNQSKKTEA